MTVRPEQLTRALPDGLHLQWYVNFARLRNGVDREVLETMILDVGKLPGTLVLCGWSDYAKHLVNLFGENDGVLCIADDSEVRQGWSFRGVPVVPVAAAVATGPDHFVCTNFEDRVRYLAEVTAQKQYRNQDVWCFPRPATAENQFYQPWKNSKFYRELYGGVHTVDRPRSMLNLEKLQFLLETARQTLHLSGDVLEVGAWQGGSAWPLAKLVVASDSDKRVLLLDFYEELERTNPEGVMCLDEIRHWFSFYPRAEIHSGNADLNPEAIVSGEWCFIHYDTGYSAERLGNCFDHLQVGGIMVLDNYGHIAGNPGRFDRWFESRGHTISSPPGSEQGWVLKH